jgi:ribonuclease HII
MSNQYNCVQIIDDSDSETETTEIKVKEEEEEEVEEIVIEPKKKTIRKPRAKKVKSELEATISELEAITSKPTPICLLKKYMHEQGTIEIGADEAGRGPMLGRVYSGAVVLPKDDSFDHFKMKDSKKFTSKNSKKIQEVAEYIKEHAIAWAVEYEDEKVIDEINILQATQSAMHKAIKSVINQLFKTDVSTDVSEKKTDVLDPNFNNLLLLIDGNYFKQLTILNKGKTKLVTVNYETVEGGDNKFTAIAAASILAKVERDKYIDELCKENPELIDRYGIDSNKGYGSKKHMDGIKTYGITKWHRRTFGICKEYV